MKLAEALIIRADSQKRVEQLKQRLSMNARVQEGETPAEDPKQLLSELNHLLQELEMLVQKINRTNSTVQFQEGQTLSDALATRDILILREMPMLIWQRPLQSGRTDILDQK